MKRLSDDDTPIDEDDGDEFAGFTVDEGRSIFYSRVAPEDEETIATPIPQNEQTVILCDPKVAGVKDGDELDLKFDGDNCTVYFNSRAIGTLKPAYIRKLRAERGGQKARVYFKKTTPPMVRITFGDDGAIDIESAEEGSATETEA